MPHGKDSASASRRIRARYQRTSNPTPARMAVPPPNPRPRMVGSIPVIQSSSASADCPVSPRLPPWPLTAAALPRLTALAPAAELTTWVAQRRSNAIRWLPGSSCPVGSPDGFVRQMRDGRGGVPGFARTAQERKLGCILGHGEQERRPALAVVAVPSELIVLSMGCTDEPMPAHRLKPPSAQ